MILQALKEYYDRKAADPLSGIALLGWERKEIPYIIVLKQDGSFVRVEDTQEMVGKTPRAKSFLVPQSVKRSSGIAANLLWDNVEYATGVVCKGTPDRVAAQHASFLERLKELDGCQSLEPVVKFLASADFKDKLVGDPAWESAMKTCAFVTFKIEGQNDPVTGVQDIVQRVNELVSNATSGTIDICRVSGCKEPICELHPPIKGVLGANTTGANIVSFNSPSASSFGKLQGLNAPVGKKAAFEYTTALNSLLSKDSRQKINVGDSTTVFWSQRQSSLEDEFADLFNEPPEDNPDRGVEAVERLFKSVENGSPANDESNMRFYVLGLSPNAARLSIRFWYDGTVGEMEKRFVNWFENLRIVHGTEEPEHLSLWRLLVSTATLGKSENIPPNLAGAVMRSILEGTAYPSILLSSTIRRINAEHRVTYPRAKLIKAYLNHNNKRSISVSLDKNNTDIGYRLGRLFAILERIQQAANPGLNATIRDKFYPSASSAPVTVFGNLVRLSGHHLSKLDSDKKGLRIWLEKQLEEVMNGIDSFPAHLSLEEQGMFAIGYYHQRLAKKNDDTTVSTENL